MMDAHGGTCAGAKVASGTPTIGGPRSVPCAPPLALTAPRPPRGRWVYYAAEGSCTCSRPRAADRGGARPKPLELAADGRLRSSLTRATAAAATPAGPPKLQPEAPARARSVPCTRRRRRQSRRLALAAVI